MEKPNVMSISNLLRYVRFSFHWSLGKYVIFGTNQERNCALQQTVQKFANLLEIRLVYLIQFPSLSIPFFNCS